MNNLSPFFPIGKPKERIKSNNFMSVKLNSIELSIFLILMLVGLFLNFIKIGAIIFSKKGMSSFKDPLIEINFDLAILFFLFTRLKQPSPNIIPYKRAKSLSTSKFIYKAIKNNIYILITT